MPDLQPNLGYGHHSEADIDHVNIWMRSQPWYLNQLKIWGMRPDNVHLTDSQRQQVVRLAQAHGVVVDEGHDEVDASGNFRPQGHKLRNTLIVVGIAAATIATMGAAGVFAAAGAPGLTGTVGATAAGAYGPMAAGYAGATTAASVPASLAATGGLAAAGGAAGATAAGAYGPMAGGYAGATTEAAVPSSLAATGGVSSTIARTLGKGGSTAQRIADLFGTGASVAGKATDTAYDNRIAQQILELQAAEDNARNLYNNQDLNQRGSQGTDRLNLEDKLGTERLNLEGFLGATRANTEGNYDFEAELMNRAKEEGTQRHDAMKDVYRASAAENPRVSPFDPAGAPKFSPDYLASLAATSQQGRDRLTKAPQYGTDTMPGVKPYTDITAPTYANTTRSFTPTPPPTPLDVKALPSSTPGKGEQVGNWLGPGLTIAEQIAQFWAMKGK